jgi:hypothetical protein
MGVHSLSVQLLPFFFEDRHRIELVGPDVVHADVDAELERYAQVEGAADQEPGFRTLRRIKLILGAVVATAAFRGIRAEAGITEFVAPEGPVHEESQGGLFRPLPG